MPTTTIMDMPSLHQENHFCPQVFPGFKAISQDMPSTLEWLVMPCDAL
jgi:hypothetical protein